MNFLRTGPALTHLCALNVWHVVDVKYLLNDKERSSIAGTRWGGGGLVEKAEGFFASTYSALPINLFEEGDRMGETVATHGH